MCVLLTIYSLISQDIDAVWSILCGDKRLLPPIIARGIFWSPWSLTYAVQYRAIDLSISNRLSCKNSSAGCAALCPEASILNILTEFRASRMSQNQLFTRFFEKWIWNSSHVSNRHVIQGQISLCWQLPSIEPSRPPRPIMRVMHHQALKPQPSTRCQLICWSCLHLHSWLNALWHIYVKCIWDPLNAYI